MGCYNLALIFKFRRIFSKESNVIGPKILSFSLDIPANIANKNKIEFVAFITGADNKTINSRKASPNVEQTFEEL